MSEADRVIRRLQSSDPDFDDCADAVAVINELRTELAALKAGQGEAVAEVLSNRIGNDTATIDKALWPGTKLYTAPPALADARLVSVELLKRVCVDRCYPAGHTISIRAIDELRALLARQETKP